MEIKIQNDSVEDPEFFEAALADIEENIASYPEWMGVEYGDPTGLEKTFASILSRKKQGKWYPEVSLLIGRHQYSMAKGREEIANLLQIWNKVTLKLGNLQRGAAAQLQSVISRLPTDCQAVIKEYKRLQWMYGKNTCT